VKVLDLKCVHGHSFEGWFGSESDFVEQCQNSLVQCPVCGDPSVVKKLSAPRLHLSGSRIASEGERDSPVTGDSTTSVATPADAWLALARQVVANTTDVGERFAEEARMIHYGERQGQGIRGTATLQEAQALAEEGIEVVPFLLPAALKGRLQ
jgi:hypothetical protein